MHQQATDDKQQHASNTSNQLCQHHRVCQERLTHNQQLVISASSNEQGNQPQATTPNYANNHRHASRTEQRASSNNQQIHTTSSAGQHDGWWPVASSMQCPCQNVRVTNDLQTIRKQQTTTNAKNSRHSADGSTMNKVSTMMPFSICHHCNRQCCPIPPCTSNVQHTMRSSATGCCLLWLCAALV